MIDKLPDRPVREGRVPLKERLARPSVSIEQKPAPEPPSTQERAPLRELPPPTQPATGTAEHEGLLDRFKTKKRKPVPGPVQPKDETTKNIELILSEGLTDLYREMPQHKQVEFRYKGEETAKKIRELFLKPKLKLKKLLKLLIEWLKVIPGVSRFFLEQEAKIKAERLLELHEEEKTHRLQ